MVSSDVMSYIKAKHLEPVSEVVELPPSPSPKPSTAAQPPKLPRAATPIITDAEFTDIELSNMRSVIASRLTLSKVCVDSNSTFVLGLL